MSDQRTMARAARRGLAIWLLAGAAGGRLAPAEEDAGKDPRAGAGPAPAPAEKPSDEPAIGIRFKGFLPGSSNPKLSGTFRVEFTIYPSPEGGEPLWREAQDVEVVDGRMDVVLGRRVKIPMAIHEATFKFLGAAVGGKREVHPRFPIVNVVYVSAQGLPAARAGAPADSAPTAVETSAASAGGRLPPSIGERAEARTTWRQALANARAAGGDLPDHEDWYRALESATLEAARERAAHYEWVLPWVYDTASHGRYNALFRGRFQGCDYLDLSPGNAYVYRIARPGAVKDPAGSRRDR